ncbi:hypothetical protein TRVL_07242 [Trypanosoma vivax]|nr:hypothetical protein TRVL_07242 [Trypanosoma vivax]
MATSRSQLRQQAACAATNINDTPQAVDTVRLHAAVIGSTSLRQALTNAFLCSFALLSLISPMCAQKWRPPPQPPVARSRSRCRGVQSASSTGLMATFTVRWPHLRLRLPPSQTLLQCRYAQHQVSKRLLSVSSAFQARSPFSAACDDFHVADICLIWPTRARTACNIEARY